MKYKLGEKVFLAEYQSKSVIYEVKIKAIRITETGVEYEFQDFRSQPEKELFASLKDAKKYIVKEIEKKYQEELKKIEKLKPEIC